MLCYEEAIEQQKRSPGKHQLIYTRLQRHFLQLRRFVIMPVSEKLIFTFILRS